MTHILTLYLGNSDICREVQDDLQHWCAGREDIALSVESIHTNPAVALRLHITELPALVLEEAVLVQGSPDQWLDSTFYERLTAMIGTADDC